MLSTYSISLSDETLHNEGDIGSWRIWYAFFLLFCELYFNLGYTVTLIRTSIYMPSFSYDLDLTRDTKFMLPDRS